MTIPSSTPAYTVPHIPGYAIVEQLYLGLRTTVYRAIQTDSQHPVVIKVLRREYPSFGELVQFRNQYAITKNLLIPGIVRPLRLEPLGNSYALVMEDYGGISLEAYLRQHSLELSDVWAIALQLANILHDLHLNRVIHKDIKPANILIHPESKQVQLIDFSIASLLPKETQEIQNPNILEGTLAYLSPEQTGRMNRGIDYRTDFYSLGITLYYLLSRQLPFESQDPIELVHCHIAKVPTPVNQIKPEVPAIAAAIISKLMAKNAEDRYQSAMGLKHDLQQCLTQWQETGVMAEFPLGQKDLCDRFIIPEKLYGRETEVQVLLDAFERVAVGTTELMLVAGFSGIGKTAVVNEVHKPIVRQRGYFIKGKFDQFNRNIPFFAFVQAFRDLVGQLLSENDAQLQTWKTRILEALGDNAQVIIELIPELERVIGTQPPVPELSGTAAQNRFNLLFPKFIQVFTQPEHPLVMFIDDLQWADSASLNLIQVLMTETNTGYLLLLGAYRDNEVAAAHPLMLSLEGMEKAGAMINTITLQPLSFTSLNHLIADTIYAQEAVVKPLTELVMQKTQGNPFFATQFLKALHQDQLITFDPDAGHWQCDIVQVRDAALTDDVVEFMALQLQKLPETTQSILKFAACIGAQFDLTTLAIVSQQSQSEVATALWKALQEGLVLPQSDIYKFYLGDTKTTHNYKHDTLHYKFLHDRVQQATYSLIPQNQTQATHLKIGQLLQKNLSASAKEEKLFDIVGHLNLGQSLITQASERKALAQLNLTAGLKAKASTAYLAAKDYLEMATQYLSGDHWHTDYCLTLEIYRALAEVEYLSGDFQRSEFLISWLLTQVNSPLEKADLLSLRVIQLTMQNDYDQALKTGLTALSLLGIEVEQEDLERTFERELQQVQQQLTTLQQSTPTLLQLPAMSHPVICAAMKVLSSMHPVAYIVNRSLLNVLVLKAVNLSLAHGHSPESAPTYSWYSLLLGSFLGDYPASLKFGELALQLAINLNSPLHKCQAFDVFSNFCSVWVRPLAGTVALNQEAFQAALDSGEFPFAGYISVHQIFNAVYLGHHLADIDADVKKFLAFAEKIGHHYAVDALLGSQLTLSNLLATTEMPLSFDTSTLTERNYLERFKNQNFYALCRYLVLKAQVLYWHGAYEQAWEAISRAEEKLDYISSTISVAAWNFVQSLIACARWETADETEQLRLGALLDRNQMQLSAWSTHCPENFLHKLWLIDAERCRIKQDISQAIALYDHAIAGAKANGYIQEEALANELAAKFYLNWGKEKVAAGYMQEAYYCYARWGAKAKVADLETCYPNLLRPILEQAEASMSILNALATISLSNVSSYISTRKSPSSNSINQSLDFAAIFKSSQALSSTIQFDELLHQLTQIILQNSGAEHCALILPSNTGEWQVRAIATPQETQLCAEPLTNNPHVPVKLIQYVKNTKEVVVIDNMETTLPVIGDYLRQQQPKSVLCLPLLHQGHLIGILYLKNQLTRGVFTADRIFILNFLCTQAAISLENARLYQQLEYSLQDAQQKSQDLAEVLALSHGQQRILALIAQGVSLKTILAETTQFIESHSHHPAYCSFVLIDAEGRLRHGAAPSLPAAYNALVDGIKIGPSVGSCGTAAYYKASVTVTDITTDPLWANYQVALDFGLRACASTPILGTEGQVLATLAMYQPVAGEFTLHDHQLMEVATYLARIAIERHQADIELQNTQLQVLQSEKMASLGNLVAGVAHEINNPIGFLNGSINNAKDYAQDLLKYIKTYHQHQPPTEAVAKLAQKIDLEFLFEDLPKLLNSMQGATDRIQGISTSLRSFSRVDNEHKVSANLHDGLNSTLLILKYRLKANEFRPAIAIIQDYGNLPEIQCFPGRLNQVFMNILANAIDMFDEMAQTLSWEAIQANPQQITIHTQQVGEQVQISIRDNGKGMSQEVQAKIFDHSFTTKPVGKGTGLGLAIARQIIVEKHGGNLEVHSVLGQGSEFLIQLSI